MTRQGDIRPLSSLVTLSILLAGGVLIGHVGSFDSPLLTFSMIAAVVITFIMWSTRWAKPLEAWYWSRYGISTASPNHHILLHEAIAGCFVTGAIVALIPYGLARQFGLDTEAFALLPAAWCVTRWRFSRHAAHWGAMAIIASAVSCIPIRTLPTDVVWILVFPVIGYAIDQALLETDRRRSGLNHKSADNQPDQFQPNLQRQAKNHKAVTLNPG